MNSVTLTTVRKVKGGKFQIEIAEVIDNPTAMTNVAAMLNKADSRFNQSAPKPRRAWQSAEAAQLLEYFKIDVSKLKFDEKGYAQVGLLNPSLSGQPLHIQIVDSFEPSYTGQNPKLSVGGDGKTRYFMKDGKHIYSNTVIVAGTNFQHKIIKSDSLIEAPAIVSSAANVG